MKTWKILFLTTASASSVLLLGFTAGKVETPAKESKPKGCVFRTVMGEESAEAHFIYKTPENISGAVDKALAWLAKSQNRNGGWGAGSHSQQNVTDPHAVVTDPATTAMVGMALLRSGNTLSRGRYSMQLRKALDHLLSVVDASQPGSPNITTVTGTQIQTKLGQNIDVILASQFFTNMLDYTRDDALLTKRIKKAVDVCVEKIQRNQNSDGSTRGAGWAGVLQSSFATNALESAQANGASVDEKALDKARNYQKENYNAQTGETKTDMGAGVVLYSVTGSARASAKEARKVKEEIEKAKQEGRLSKNAAPSAQTLQEIGYARDEAIKYSTAYEVYESAKVKSQRDDVMDGFGSNGGEEFLSYLQTGESMIINKDNSWQKWYDNVAGRMVKIQNADGSWNGHHCITSPVFCTATCLLILGVNNDIEKLVEMGGK